jgi:hypothetical protein
MTTEDTIYYLPMEILCQIFSEYLSLQDISRLDVAMCNEKNRPACGVTGVISRTPFIHTLLATKIATDTTATFAS